jgi:hypothetical protein
MRVFEFLRRLRLFERQNLTFVETLEDIDILHVVGEHQVRGVPLTLKQMRAFDIGASATVERRLARLKELGVIVQAQSKLDKRNHELKLSSRTLRIFQRYADTIPSFEHTSPLDQRPE